MIFDITLGSMSSNNRIVLAAQTATLPGYMDTGRSTVTTINDIHHTTYHDPIMNTLQKKSKVDNNGAAMFSLRRGLNNTFGSKRFPTTNTYFSTLGKRFSTITQRVKDCTLKQPTLSQVFNISFQKGGFDWLKVIIAQKDHPFLKSQIK